MRIQFVIFTSALKKGGRSLPTSPRLLKLVSHLKDILCINNLLTLPLLNIVKPYLSTNKQYYYITFIFLWRNKTRHLHRSTSNQIYPNFIDSIKILLQDRNFIISSIRTVPSQSFRTSAHFGFGCFSLSSFWRQTISMCYLYYSPFLDLLVCHILILDWSMQSRSATLSQNPLQMFLF